MGAWVGAIATYRKMLDFLESNFVVDLTLY